ncbi:hypothetical protein [Pontibacter sp. G13]|uniref:ATP-binding protein n=1 Tax=Pontibacter sp. G13 TaxID=3074898 RepID=UPI00288C55F3|nr:hypothetical protein [Pontibacter sp. G13]WNJ16872.1 hypothetical protein RJD25_18565 [Pontibacter sp. G13]
MDNSPFKFLDAYGKQDVDIFFGRKKETRDLFQTIQGVKHLLVFGPSGAGKTSLINCGLRNQFSITDWYAISIRRGVNIIESVYRTLNKHAEQPLEIPDLENLPFDQHPPFRALINRIYEYEYKPIYLLFDQFEELLISGSHTEKVIFFKLLDQLVRERLPCKVILIMREEFIGHLSGFERYCPHIFDHRFRLEKMRIKDVQGVIRKTLMHPGFQDTFQVADVDEMVHQITTNNVDEHHQQIELTHIQVYLNLLWQRAIDRRAQPGDAILLSPSLLNKQDDLPGILKSFLETQLAELAPTYSKDIPLEVLVSMITEQDTKVQQSLAGIQAHFSANDLEQPPQRKLRSLLQAFVQRKILRPIRFGNEARHEISHDTLAKVIGESRTSEMELRRKAQSVYQVYLDALAENNQILLSQPEIDRIRGFAEVKTVPKELEKLLEDSRQAIQQDIQQEAQKKAKALQAQADRERDLRKKAESNATRARRLTGLASLVSIVAVIVAGVAFNYYHESEDAKDHAEDELKKRILSEKLAAGRSLANNAKRYADLGELEKACEVYRIAQDTLQHYDKTLLYQDIQARIEELSCPPF